MIKPGMKKEEKHMEVEIWSDVMCPWCYIGKRRFGAALDRFPEKHKVRVTWKSFQLNPGMKTDPDKSINAYLAEIKGWAIERAQQSNDYVTALAAKEGLTYRFDRAIVANSFDAHRLLQMAKAHDLGDAAEERLFHAYFTEGKNTADHATLVTLGAEIGLDRDEVAQMLRNNTFAAEVRQDVTEAQQLGIRGVPFYVIDRKYGISGAQETGVFLQALRTAFAERQARPSEPLPGGDACGVEGDCAD